MVICIINSSHYFIVAGILIYRGVCVPAYADTKVQLKKAKAKGFLLSLFFFMPVFAVAIHYNFYYGRNYAMENFGEFSADLYYVVAIFQC